MKKYNRLMALYLLLLAVLISSCSKEDLIPESNNTITLDGQAFKVTMVTLLGISMDEVGHAAMSLMNTNGITTRTLTVDFEYTAAQSISGTYTFPQTDGTRQLDAWLTNYTEMSATGDINSTNLKKGSVSVTDNGNSSYTIILDLEMTDGKKFKGTYQGPVQEAYHNE